MKQETSRLGERLMVQGDFKECVTLLRVEDVGKIDGSREVLQVYVILCLQAATGEGGLLEELSLPLALAMLRSLCLRRSLSRASFWPTASSPD